MNRTVIAVVCLAVLGALITISEYDTRRTRERAGELVARITAAELAIKAQSLQIDVIQALYAAQAAALAKARKKDAEAEEFYAEREDKAHQLDAGDAGQSVRQWRGRRVPDAVKRLYEHPGCANAADCYQSVRTGDAMPGAGDKDGQ